MAWSPRYVDRPFRLLFEPEVWAVTLFILGVVSIVFNLNNAVAMFAAVAVGTVIQKITDRNKKGYIIHMFHVLGLGIFKEKYGRYRI